MSIVREEDSTRLRASLRGLLPAVVTLVLLVAGGISLRVVVDAFVEDISTRGTLSLLLARMLLYVGLIGVAIWGGSKLDRRHYADFGLNVDAEWVRSFAAGVVISWLALFVSLSWGVFRGLREFDVAAAGMTGPGGPLVLGVLLALFVGYFLVQNIYEEVVYRGIVLQNFMEGLAARGFSPAWAVVPATTASALLFGLYHLPLRGNFVVVIDAAMVGITLSLAYLLTGELGLPVGVHFGRLPFEFVTGLGITTSHEIVQIVKLSQDTLPANLEVKLVRLGATCLCILTWVYLVSGDIRIADAVYRRDRNRPDTS